MAPLALLSSVPELEAWRAVVLAELAFCETAGMLTASINNAERMIGDPDFPNVLSCAVLQELFADDPQHREKGQAGQATIGK